MKLSEKALLALESEPSAEDEGPVMSEDEAFGEALELYAKGDKKGAAASLRAAVEMCIAGYDKGGDEDEM